MIKEELVHGQIYYYANQWIFRFNYLRSSEMWGYGFIHNGYTSTGGYLNYNENVRLANIDEIDEYNILIKNDGYVASSQPEYLINN